MAVYIDLVDWEDLGLQLRSGIILRGGFCGSAGFYRRLYFSILAWRFGVDSLVVPVEEANHGAGRWEAIWLAGFRH